jgi:hypothetical protein
MCGKFKEKSTHHVVSNVTGYHVDPRTAHVLLDLNVFYLKNVRIQIK